MSFSDGNLNEMIYLDHNATSPLAPELKPKIVDWLEAWGNPSSIHRAGRKPKALLRDSRKAFAHMIGCDQLEVIFTSGGSESNNLAIKGVYEFMHSPGAILPNGFRNRYLFSSVEHPSVQKTAEFLKSRGAEVEFISVNREGQIDLEQYKSLLNDKTALVSVMLANNETGVIFPIREMAELAHQHGALFHTDAVQALGKIPVNVQELGVDLASFSGHKFYSLKGVGVLFSRKGTQLESLIHGGAQERHRRGGTENLLAIASLGEMAKSSHEIGPKGQKLEILRDHLENRLKNEIACLSVNSENARRLPNTSSMIIDGVDGETLLMNLDIMGFAVSTGAACSSGSPEPSPVLIAMGITRDEAQSSLRVGLGWSNTNEQIDLFIEALKEVVARIRSFSSEDVCVTGKPGVLS